MFDRDCVRDGRRTRLPHIRISAGVPQLKASKVVHEWHLTVDGDFRSGVAALMLLRIPEVNYRRPLLSVLLLLHDDDVTLREVAMLDPRLVDEKEGVNHLCPAR